NSRSIGCHSGADGSSLNPARHTEVRINTAIAGHFASPMQHLHCSASLSHRLVVQADTVRARALAVSARPAGHWSAALPCAYTAPLAALTGSMPPARRAPTMPASTSPVPAVASRALPVGLMAG